MPRARPLALPAPLTFSADERAALEAGFVPREMDDRWFCFCEDGRLHLVRSWTGATIFELRLAERPGGGAEVSEVLVNDDRARFRADDVVAAHILEDTLRWLSAGPR
jgi:hypothetical protein